MQYIINEISVSFESTRFDILSKWIGRISLCLVCFVFDYSGLLAQDSDTELSVVWTENFEVFPSPEWQGDVGWFEAVSMNNRPMLRQRGDPQAGVHAIFRPLKVGFGRWTFSVTFDGFTTSNQNRSWFWLTIDDPISPSGHAVRIGENGTIKYIRIFELRGASPAVEILRSQYPMPEGNQEIQVVVERSPTHIWKLGFKSEEEDEYRWTETYYRPENLIEGNWFGIQNQFTTTRSDRFFFGPIQIEKFPLFLTDFRVVSNRLIQLDFSEALPEEILSQMKVHISEYQAEINLSVSGNRITLELEKPLSGGVHQLTLSGIKDPLTGAALNDISLNITVFDIPEVHDVVISEFTPRPVPGADFRFLEIFNASDKFLDISRWVIGRSGQQVVLSTTKNEPLILYPGRFALLSPNPGIFNVPDTVLLVNVNLPAFGRTQDAIWLRSDDGILIDSIRYDTSWNHALMDGRSVEKRNLRYAGMDSDNWAKHPVSHSAGAGNQSQSIFETEPVIGSIVSLSETRYQVRFSRFMKLTEATGIQIDGRQPSETYSSIWTGNILDFTLQEKPSWFRTRSATVTISFLSSYDGKNTYHLSKEISQPLEKGDLVINEILYQPIQDRYAGFPDQSEFVEFKNLRSFSISLEGVFLRDTEDKDGTYRTWVPLDSKNWQIEANGYAVIYPDTARLFHKTRLASFFDLADANNFARSDRMTLGLTTSGRGVYVSNAKVKTIDSVYYRPQWHHPLLGDTRGVSLERISATGTSTGINWSSSAAVRGGTPGDRNSVAFEEFGESRASKSIEIHPNPFSPDLDGHQDFMTVSIVFPQPGFLTRIRIYDRFGRLVRDLVRDEIAGSSFLSIWDGRNMQNNLLTTGIYIVHVQASHFENGLNIEFKEPVVLVRRR